MGLGRRVYLPRFKVIDQPLKEATGGGFRGSIRVPLKGSIKV